MVGAPLAHLCWWLGGSSPLKITGRGSWKFEKSRFSSLAPLEKGVGMRVFPGFRFPRFRYAASSPPTFNISWLRSRARSAFAFPSWSSFPFVREGPRGAPGVLSSTLSSPLAHTLFQLALIGGSFGPGPRRLWSRFRPCLWPLVARRQGASSLERFPARCDPHLRIVRRCGGLAAARAGLKSAASHASASHKSVAAGGARALERSC